MLTNSRYWKYFAVMLGLAVLLVVGMQRSISVLAVPPIRSHVVPLAAGGTLGLVDHRPVKHEIGVNVTSDITGAFDQEVNPTTVNTDTFAVHGGFSGVMTGTYPVNGHEQDSPSRPYFAGEQVHVIATSGISSVGGLPLKPTQWSFTAGPVKPRCVGGFSDIGAGLTGVIDSSVAWGDYDNDGDLDILLTGDDGQQRRCGQGLPQRRAAPSRGHRRPATLSPACTAVRWRGGTTTTTATSTSSSPAMTGSTLVWPRCTANDGGTFTRTSAASAGLTGVFGSSVAWGDYDNDGDLDILLTGYDGQQRLCGQGLPQRRAAPSRRIRRPAPACTGVYISSVAWGDYDNDGDLDILLTGYDGSRNRVAKVYRNDGGTFTSDISAGSAPACTAVRWRGGTTTTTATSTSSSPAMMRQQPRGQGLPQRRRHLHRHAASAGSDRGVQQFGGVGGLRQRRRPRHPPHRL